MNGSLGIFYCPDIRALISPFRTLPHPDLKKRVTNDRRGTWELPFGIEPLTKRSQPIAVDELAGLAGLEKLCHSLSGNRVGQGFGRRVPWPGWGLAVST